MNTVKLSIKCLQRRKGFSPFLPWQSYINVIILNDVYHFAMFSSILCMWYWWIWVWTLKPKMMFFQRTLPPTVEAEEEVVDLIMVQVVSNVYWFMKGQLVDLISKVYNFMCACWDRIIVLGLRYLGHNNLLIMVTIGRVTSCGILYIYTAIKVRYHWVILFS